MSFWGRGLWLRAQGPGRGSRKFGSSEGRQRWSRTHAARVSEARGSRLEAQGPRSEIRDPRSEP
ncbi:conserved hypothetical protein [Burkholderia pseudomallei Pasteur 52237]|nr:conserved hypothetical protein [Burkholderia pseudomallei Pasteur 52237]